MIYLFIGFMIAFPTFAQDTKWSFAKAGSSICRLSSKGKIDCKVYDPKNLRYKNASFESPKFLPSSIHDSTFSPYGLFCPRDEKGSIACYRHEKEKLKLIFEKNLGSPVKIPLATSTLHYEVLSLCTVLESQNIQCWESRKKNPNNRDFIPKLHEKSSFVIRSRELKAPIDYFTIADNRTVHEFKLNQKTFVLNAKKNIYTTKVIQKLQNNILIMEINREFKKVNRGYRVKRMYSEPYILTTKNKVLKWNTDNGFSTQEIKPKGEKNYLKLSNLGNVFECNSEGYCFLRDSFERTSEFRFSKNLLVEKKDDIFELGHSYCVIKNNESVFCQPIKQLIKGKDGHFKVVGINDVTVIKVF